MKPKKLFKGNGWIEFMSDDRGARSMNKNLEPLHKNLFSPNEMVLIFTDVELWQDLTLLNIFCNDKHILQLSMTDINIIYADSKESKTPNEILVVDGDYKKTANSTLCGNEFRGENLVIADPGDLAFGEVLEKKCENCFFKPIQDPKKCNIITGKGNMHPRTLFRRRKNEKMPSIIDGKQVAQYCKYFTHWNVE